MGKFTNLPVVSPEKSVVQRTQKTCSTCGSTKSIGEFHKRKGTPDGRTYYCRGCHSEMSKRHYERTREHQIQKAMEWNKAHPERHRVALARYQRRPEIRKKIQSCMPGYQQAYRIRKKGKISRGVFVLREPHQRILAYLKTKTSGYILSNTIAQDISLNLGTCKILLKDLRLSGYLESAHKRGYKLKIQPLAYKEEYV